MKIIFQQHKLQLRRQRGLTLVEMMVATTLLVVMMLGLTAMFNQTQRAFRSGLKQVDVFEGGRAIMDLVVRDVEQLVASKTTDWSLYSGIQMPIAAPNPPSLLQYTPKFEDGIPLRTNVLHSVFFLNYVTDWSALGYRVLDPNNINSFDTLSFGSLYRFSTNNFSDFGTTPNYYYDRFNTNTPSALTNGYLTRVADGVVHFSLKFYDGGGTLIPAYNSTNNAITNNLPPSFVTNPVTSGVLINEQHIGFYGDVLPAMVEIELGILEPQTLEQARSVANPVAYLEKQGGKVHIFRQQIPIRNAPR